MEYYGLTDIGKVRSQNQDFFYCNHSDSDGWYFLVVCDGMGGAKAGNVASELATGVFSDTFLSELSGEFNADHVEACMLKGLDSANTAVFNMSQSDYKCRGMGTTLVAAFIYNGCCSIINVGDSRAYLLNNNDLSQVTHDHSYVQRLLDAGAISEEEAKYHKNRNVITRAVGTANNVRGDIFRIELNEGSRIMLCSDGLVNMADYSEIKQLLSCGSARESCEALVGIALDRGATDNTTVVVFDA